MITIDRNEFMAWMNGILLIRKKDEVFVVNEIECEKAEQHVLGGGTIYLTVKGRPYSKMSGKGEIIEERIEVDEYLEVLRTEWI